MENCEENIIPLKRVKLERDDECYQERVDFSLDSVKEEMSVEAVDSVRCCTSFAMAESKEENLNEQYKYIHAKLELEEMVKRNDDPSDQMRVASSVDSTEISGPDPALECPFLPMAENENSDEEDLESENQINKIPEVTVEWDDPSDQESDSTNINDPDPILECPSLPMAENENSDEEDLESENQINKIPEVTVEWDDPSDQESVASSTGSANINDPDPVLEWISNDDASSDEEWIPIDHSRAEITPQKRKRSSQSSPAAKKTISSPAPIPCFKWRGCRKSANRSLSFSLRFPEHKWHSAEEPDIEPPQPIFRPLQTPGPQLVSNALYSPLQFFELFFSTSVMQTVVANTNAYGAKYQEGKWRGVPWHNITVKDLKSYLALVIYMGLVKCTSLSDYWRKSEVYSLPFPAQIMSCRKFLAISHALHLSDPKVDAENEQKKGTPEYDRLCKIKPLYEDIRDACKTTFHPFQNIAIDERMVASKARNRLKQYMKNKPTKWGYKLFVLADSLSGYTWDFFVYQGKMDPQQCKGISYQSVMSLVDEKILGTGYKVFVDNFYTSPALFKDLLSKQIWACGTVRANRIGHSKKPAPRGNIRWCRDDKLLFVEWKDRRDVLMCSTFHKAFNGDTVKRNVKKANGVWTMKDFPVPPAVLDYNKHMGGVDLSDALIGYYTVLHKTKKWYRSFFYHFVDIAIVNAFIMYKHMAKTTNQKLLTQKAFREAIVSELAETLYPAGSVALASSDVPFNAPHLPTYISGDSGIGRRTCKLCHMKTPVICLTCNVTLCFVPARNCFTDWHESGKGDE